jgi:hypothetical protein
MSVNNKLKLILPLFAMLSLAACENKKEESATSDSNTTATTTTEAPTQENNVKSAEENKAE